MSRLSGRVRIFARALPRLASKPLRRKPQVLKRILIAHHLLLGDTLLLTPLVAKLRAQYPDAQIVLTCPKPIVPLYAGKPFGIDVIPFDPRDVRSVTAVLRSWLGIIVMRGLRLQPDAGGSSAMRTMSPRGRIGRSTRPSRIRTNPVRGPI